MSKVKIALIGLGNAGSYLSNGIYGSDINLWHERVGGLTRKDIEIVGAFDIDSKKVGKTVRAVTGVGPEIEVMPSISYKDEIGREIADRIKITSTESSEFEKQIKRLSPDIVLNLISSGQDRASLEIAKISSKNGCSVINATPTLMISESSLVSGFKKSKGIIAGDDLQSQIGGTWLHRVMLMAFRKWGTSVIRSYQLDVGGSLETLNTLDERIREKKKEVKGEAVANEDKRSTVIAGTTDYIPFLEDWRISHFYMEINGPLNEKFTIDAEYKTRDGPNALNVVLDVLRAVTYEKSEGNYGTIPEINAYGFKSHGKDNDVFSSLEAFERKYIK
jgi:myo-inositol-1-phosphate synthase